MAFSFFLYITNMTKGIKKFISTIYKFNPQIKKSVLKDIESFIIDSKCPDIKFEDLSEKAAGISKTDECIISTIVFRFPIEYMLYMILHEISHQYQYKKYGKDLVLDVYLNDTPLQDATEKLLYIEKIADRLALMKMKQIFKKNNITSRINPVPRYLNMTDLTKMREHVQSMRDGVAKLNLKTIEEINDHLYSKIK